MGAIASQITNLIIVYSTVCSVIMSAMASQIISLIIVYSTVYSGTDQRKHHSSASLACEREIHRWPVNSPHKGPITRKMFPLDDVIMNFHRPWRHCTVINVFTMAPFSTTSQMLTPALLYQINKMINIQMKTAILLQLFFPHGKHPRKLLTIYVCTKHWTCFFTVTS